MAAKISLITLESLQNETTAIQTLNENFGLIATALDNTFSRDGTTPNTMQADVDINDRRLINLGTPLNGTDAARLADIADALAVDSLTLIPAMTGNVDKILSNDGTVLYWAQPSDIPGLGDLIAANNLSDVASASTSRTNLGLGTAATYNVGTSGSNVPLMDSNNTYSGGNTYSGTSSFTGAVSLAGTGDHRLTSTPTVLTPESVGFRGAPTSTQDTDYTFVLGDSGKMKLHTSGTGHAYTIPLNATVAFPIGTVLLLANIGAGAVTITRTGGVTLRQAGTSTDADATFAQWGFASLVKIDTNVWVASGTGLS